MMDRCTRCLYESRLQCSGANRLACLTTNYGAYKPINRGPYKVRTKVFNMSGDSWEKFHKHFGHNEEQEIDATFFIKNVGLACIATSDLLVDEFDFFKEIHDINRKINY